MKDQDKCWRCGGYRYIYHLRPLGLAPKIIPCPDCNKEDEIKEMNGKKENVNE